jgi:hypothetical protein
MSKNRLREHISACKEWLGSERPRNIFKSIKVYTTNFKPNK